MVSAVTAAAAEAEEELKPSGGAGISYPSSGGSRSPLFLNVTTDEIRLGWVECLWRWERIYKMHTLQGWAKKSFPGFVNFFPAVADHFCLNFILS